MRRRKRGGGKPKRAQKKRTGVDADWVPKTKLGMMVKEGKITTMSAALKTRAPLKEPEIVDVLLPNLDEEVLDVNMVQRMTDSGRRVSFAVTMVVGNGNGFVGLGYRKGKEVAPTIRKAIDHAKLNLIEIKRGCGSWECGCWEPHSVPFKVVGRSSSSTIVLKPAPRGVALVAGDAIKPILKLAGIKDVWTFTKGQTRTTLNYTKATFDALKNISATKVTRTQTEALKIATGPTAEMNEVQHEEKGEAIAVRRKRQRRRK